MLQDLKRLFIENGEIKAVLSTIAVFLSWAFNGEHEALYAICVVLILDFLTGTHCALRNGKWNSRRSLQGVSKFFRYLVYMLIARMIDKVVPIAFASPIMDTYIIITESGSILENFAKMGHPVPLELINKLKTFYEKKS